MPLPIRVYRGDWYRGAMHGCGTCIWRPQGGELDAVGDGGGARADAVAVTAAEGKYFAGEFVGDVMPCGPSDARDAAVDADVAAFQARSFKVGTRAHAWRKRCLQ